MSLEKLPDYRDTVIVVGTSCRKPLSILAPHLASLDWQELPPRTLLHYVYVPDFVQGQQDAQEHLMRFVNERGGELIQGHPLPPHPDFNDSPGTDSHQWGQTAMARVGANKNLIIQRALELKADFLFLVDSDLLLDKTTIKSLLDCEKPIVTATYWTRWSKQKSETAKIYAGPQVWLRHPYELHGRGMDEAEFREKLLSRGVIRVWGFGAATLINRRVLETGLNFDYLPEIPLQGLMGGEDRHFCIKAERMHIDAYADNWPDIFHIYHADEDIAKIPRMAELLGRPHHNNPSIGDLVSLRLRPLEPLPVAPGRFQNSAPQQVRGRLGAIGMLPEIEEVVRGLKRGEKQIAKVNFPIHSPVGYLRGRQRLIEISLLDCKPMCYPPVVEDDLVVLPQSGRFIAA